MASIKFLINGSYLCEKIQYLDEESYEYKYYQVTEFSKIIEKINLIKSNFIFSLENPDNEDDGYSLVCTNSHRKKATKCSAQLSETGEEIIFKLIATVEIPLRADPYEIQKLRLSLKRLDLFKGKPDGFSFEFNNKNKEFIDFLVE